MIDKTKVLLTYGITDEYATEWSEESSSTNLDLVDSASTTGAGGGDLSKYALLRELVSNANGHAGEAGAFALLKGDEMDPLGSTPSVMSVLRARGIDVDSNPSVRAKYLISSTKFSPTAFLRDVHVDATYANLTNSLDYLESSIANQSEALRDLVEREYIEFVRSKSLLDSVLDQIESTGFNSEQGWGVDNIKSNIDEANAKATVVMKPVIDSQKKEERLRSALKLIEKNKYLFNLPSIISKHIKNDNHDGLIRDYRRGKDIRHNAEDIINTNSNNNSSDHYFILQNKKITDRIWDEVESTVDEYRQNMWKKLSTSASLEAVDSNYMQLIAKLLDIGVQDNPILEWIESQIRYLNNQTVDKFDKLKLRTNLLRMNVMSVPPPVEVAFVHPLKELAAAMQFDNGGNDGHGGITSTRTAATGQNGNGNLVGVLNPGLCDSMEVVEMWINIRTVIDDISAIAAKICLFWQNCNGFLVGQKQLNLPSGYQGESETHLRFSNYEISEIKKSGRELIEIFAERTMDYFTLPAPSTTSASLLSGGMSGLSIAGNRLSGQLLSSPSPASPSSTQSPAGQETFLFSPPFGNALSASKYLSQIIFSLYSAFRELSLAGILPKTAEILRNVLTVVRERSIYAVCNCWQEDCKKFALLEDWTRAPKSEFLTKTPHYFQAYHYAVLCGIKSIVFFSPENESSELVAQPQGKLLKHVLSQFAASMSSSIDSIMTSLTSMEGHSSSGGIAAKRRSYSGNVADMDSNFNSSSDELTPQELTHDSKLLLMLSNLLEIRDNIFPQLFKFFERSFMTSSKEINTSLRASAEKMETTLFEIYTRNKRSTLSDAVREGILHSGIDWSTANQPTSVSKYVYECLLLLVTVHAKVHDISSNLTSRIISVLYEHFIKTMLTYYRQVEQFGRGGVLQATTDLEFLKIVMSQYRTTESQKTFQLIFSTIKDVSIDRTLWNNRDGPRPIVQGTVEEALRRGQVSFFWAVVFSITIY